jgi:hypothetical protein
MLMDEYKKYKDADNLFSKIYYIDWYDGGVTGILKLKDSEHWYLFNLAFFEPDEKVRIFSLNEVSANWILEIKSLTNLDDPHDTSNYEEIKAKVKNAFNHYRGDAFLLKARYIEDAQCEIVKVPVSSLKYFDHIDDTFEQDEKYIEKLKSFFPSWKA